MPIGTILVSILKRLLKRNKDAPREGVIYLGEGFVTTSGKGKSKFSAPDSNGKTYLWYTLIKKGKHQGKYAHGMSVIKSSKYRNSKQEAEALDIYESGFEIHVPTPFQNSNQYESWNQKQIKISKTQRLKPTNAKKS